MFACFETCLVALTNAQKFSAMKPDGTVLHFTSAAVVRKLLEVQLWKNKFS
jgi:hypothetical protein